jgi:serine/threonine protein phosphatase PrpC
MALYAREPILAESATAVIPGARGDLKRQDSAGRLVTAHGELMLVADGHDDTGMGGHAAALVNETVLDFYRAWDGKQARRMLVDALGMANAALRDAAKQDQRLRDIGVSTTVLHHHEGALRIAHVGKNRAYRQRNYVIDQLTEEHILQGGRQARAAGTPTAVVLDRAVGLYPIVEVDVSDAHFVQPGETYLVCTDGLTMYLSDVEIGRYCLAGQPARVCDALLGLAGEQGGRESISIAMVKFGGAPPQTKSASQAAETVPLSSMSLSPRTPAAGFSFVELSPAWKVRLSALMILLVWFCLLVVAWAGFERDEMGMLTPLLLGVVFCTAPLLMMRQWRKKRRGGRRQ